MGKMSGFSSRNLAVLTIFVFILYPSLANQVSRDVAFKKIRLLPTAENIQVTKVH